MIYGTLKFHFLGDPVTAELTEDGWRCGDDPQAAKTLNALAPPSDFGPAAGDPMARALLLAGEIFGVEPEIVPLLPGDPDVDY